MSLKAGRRPTTEFTNGERFVYDFVSYLCLCLYLCNCVCICMTVVILIFQIIEKAFEPVVKSKIKKDQLQQQKQGQVGSFLSEHKVCI